MGQAKQRGNFEERKNTAKPKSIKTGKPKTALYFNAEATNEDIEAQILETVKDFDVIELVCETEEQQNFAEDALNMAINNPSKKTYIIKYANGEGNAITFEHAQTEEGKKALEFAKAAGEEVLLLDTDEAMDVFLGMCGNADLRCDA
jgi:isocitrate dehydrogenase